MRTRSFGNTDLHVSELGLGCARIGGVFQADSSGFLKLLGTALDAGINFYDTADMYSQGESETLVGRAFRGRRDRVVIATKAGYCLPGRRRLIARLKPLVKPIIQKLGIRRDRVPAAVRGTITQDFSPAYLIKALEGSLRRLGTDYVDLLQLHSPPIEVVARGDWLEALEGLKRAGKIRYYGVSVDSVEAGLAALHKSGIASLQCVVSLLEQRAAESLVPAALAQGVGVIARECLANGQLVKSRAELDLSRFCATPAEQAERARKLDQFAEVAKAEGVRLADYALAYARNVPGVSVTLVGARSAEQLRGLLPTEDGGSATRLPASESL